MSYEPKYRLNKKDDARWRLLVMRHCLELPEKPGGKVVPHPDYPPLTPAENLELETLQRKRRAKISSHPRVQAALRCQRGRDAEIAVLIKRLETLLAPAKKKLGIK